MFRIKRKQLFAVPVLICSLLATAIIPCASVQAASVLTLTAAPNASSNYVSLNWSNSDYSQPYSYMLYSKSDKESSFQSIPAKDKVKVLNVYPDSTTGKWPVDSNITFTSSVDGKTYTLPASASAKMWMEKANSESVNGYGKGLISVDAVSIAVFNSNPNAYLKNPDGTYKYDVLFFGAWDGNAGQDLTASAESCVKAFAAAGRGLLIGHDTACYVNPVFSDLISNVNAQAFQNTNPIWNLGSTSVSIVKKGLLTNYPWNIGNVGTTLTVPLSHTTHQIAYGDIWLKYLQPFSTSMSGPETTDSSGNGTNNFYLTTWCNSALIQTGHSKGQATADEQKVLANTLFYLAQITTNTSWNDHKGQDLNAPGTPAISGVTHNTNRTQFTVSYSSKDNATGYQYYVEATGQNDSTKSDSPVVSTSIGSGLKGYSIVVDSNPNTTPDGSITTTSTSYTFNRPSGSGFYIHVAAVDNAGNVSSVTHYHVDEFVSVTHPVSINYTIDPNSSTPFTAPDIPLTNNSAIPVNVFVQSLSASTSGSIQLNNVSPIKYADWSKLTSAQTKSDIALGIGVREATTGGNAWSCINLASPIFATNISENTLLGTLSPNGAKGNLALTAKCGLAWDKSYTAVHNLLLVFEVT